MCTRWRSVIPVVVVLSLVLLAAGISRVSFVGTRYGPQEESGEEPTGAVQVPQGAAHTLSPVWEQILSGALGVLLVLSVLAAILRPRSLWEALKRALPAALWFVAILLILLRWRNRPFLREPEGAPAGMGGASPPGPDQPFPTLEQVHVPSWAPFLFVLMTLLAIAVFSWLVWRLWVRRAQPSTVEEFADLSRRYAQRLRSGEGVQETILRCYREMCRLLSARFHLEISDAMTAREFEERLAQIGVLEEHISRLSRLFEWARYSSGQPTPQQEREALTLLDDIAQKYRSSSDEVLHPA